MTTRYLDLTGTETLVGYLKDYVDTASEELSGQITGTYTVKGSSAFADLPTDASVGDVYNVTDAFTTDSVFVEGSGVEYPAGTNVVWTDDGWDCLVGTFDFSDFPTMSSDDVGSSVNPVYIFDGEIVASSGDVGGTAKPVYLADGVITETGYDLSELVASSDLVAVTTDEIAAMFE